MQPRGNEGDAAGHERNVPTADIARHAARVAGDRAVHVAEVVTRAAVAVVGDCLGKGREIQPQSHDLVVDALDRDGVRQVASGIDDLRRAVERRSVARQPVEPVEARQPAACSGRPLRSLRALIAFGTGCSLRTGFTLVPFVSLRTRDSLRAGDARRTGLARRPGVAFLALLIPGDRRLERGAVAHRVGVGKRFVDQPDRPDFAEHAGREDLVAVGNGRVGDPACER